MTNDLLPCPFCGNDDPLDDGMPEASLGVCCGETGCPIDGVVFTRRDWNIRADLVSTPNKPAEVDLDALNILNGDGILPDSIKEKVYKNWPKCDLPPEVKIATALKMGWSLDQVRDDVETTLRGCFKSIDVNDLKAELSHQICNGPESECTHCIAICQTVDYLASSGRLATGKGGGDAPQSNMVAVPREVIEEAAESIRFALNMDDLSDAEFSKLDLSLAMLQPYTRGE